MNYTNGNGSRRLPGLRSICNIHLVPIDIKIQASKFIIKFMSRRFRRKAKQLFNNSKFLFRKIFTKFPSSKNNFFYKSTSKTKSSIKVSFKEAAISSSQAKPSCSLFIPTKTLKQAAYEVSFSSSKSMRSHQEKDLYLIHQGGSIKQTTKTHWYGFSFQI